MNNDKLVKQFIRRIADFSSKFCSRIKNTIQQVELDRQRKDTKTLTVAIGIYKKHKKFVEEVDIYCTISSFLQLSLL